jgi:hypothetical protein
MISNLRALNVYYYLIDKGAKKDNFTYSGLATANPQGNNRYASGRVKNRRADIELLLNILDEPGAEIKHDSSEFESSRKKFNPNKIASRPVRSKTKNNLKDKGVKSTETAAASESKEEVSTVSKEEASTVSNVVPEKMVAPLEIGPEFSSGKVSAATNLRITATNGIVFEVDKNTYVTKSKEPIEIDFKDYSKNGEIMRKGIQTKGGNTEYKLVAAFNINFSQEYQDVSINSTKPFIVNIPGAYDPNVKLYSNHKNWTLDNINKMTYNEEKQAYEVMVINNSQMIGLLKPVAVSGDTLRYLKVKIKGLNPDYIKPYIIYDDCTISNGYHLSGKWFIFPITKPSELYRLRAAYVDYSSKNPEAYSLIADINSIDMSRMSEDENKILIKHTTKLFMTADKLPTSSLCEMQENVGSKK